MAIQDVLRKFCGDFSLVESILPYDHSGMKYFSYQRSISAYLFRERMTVAELQKNALSDSPEDYVSEA